MAAAESAPEIPIVLHLDHGDKPETCFMAIELGFTSVMMDGSLLADGKTPSDYEYNVAVTREVVEAAHAKGVSASRASSARSAGSRTATARARCT